MAQGSHGAITHNAGREKYLQIDEKGEIQVMPDEKNTCKSAKKGEMQVMSDEKNTCKSAKKG